MRSVAFIPTLFLLLFIYSDSLQTDLSAPIFPLYSALFLPPSNISEEDDHREYLATMESIRPILDVAMFDAYRYYLQGWAPGPEEWLHIKEAPIKGCDDQKEAAWATLAAYQWTNGSGLDLAFGPACDYVLASVGRILGFFKVPMFTNAGFSEYFNQKSDFPVTRVGPLQDHIVRLFGQLANQFEWKRPSFLYEKSFWESEFLEGGFCKILGNGMYAYTVERRWNLTIKAQLLEPAEEQHYSREHYKQLLMENIGNNFGAVFGPEEEDLGQGAIGPSGAKRSVDCEFVGSRSRVRLCQMSDVWLSDGCRFTHRMLLILWMLMLVMQLLAVGTESLATKHTQRSRSGSTKNGTQPLQRRTQHTQSRTQLSHNYVEPAKHAQPLNGDTHYSQHYTEIRRAQPPRTQLPHRHIQHTHVSLQRRHLEAHDSAHSRGRKKIEVSPARPIYLLFPLPVVQNKALNPFGITIDLAQPVVDIAVEEVYRRQIVQPGSLHIHFEDSRLSDAHGPNVAINHLVNNELDCIIGYGFVYALAPVARMSPYWHDADSDGIPVITSTGLTSNLDNRNEYALMTRISSPYKVVRNCVMKLFFQMNWRNSFYLFHESRHNNNDISIPYGECYLLMTSIHVELSVLFPNDHNYFMFNENRMSKDEIEEKLKYASMTSSGKVKGAR
ncbi:unnamed protein product [Bursaphelenchus okinawaensis]|uniref:Receptor ligand binding region domain-containing protein n=1 Tax=Bursaphelenchus okinawaensis TaxID=465554 RepID=A0A811JSS1_9BILA|nr:unnamed protein product [Bursaphelenchus okinawaensis]CAG9081568.1 unnamed protein product [Bursaphelenchus okinawaensis]